MASKFIARVPCRFGGKDYKIGDAIPDGVVLEKRVGALTAMGVIEPAPPAPAKAPAVKNNRPKKQPPAQAKQKAAK